MVAAPAFSSPQDFASGLDELLIQLCEDLQLPTGRYQLAVSRYNTLNRLLESDTSPFRYFQPDIYPQGSMALGTTVKPIAGPHDLDFVLQLSRDHNDVNPMALIKALFGFLQQNNTYRPMVSLKSRCVRIEYADEFYMDILPACLNSAQGEGCIKVPDRALNGWSDSNPLGYIEWFKRKRRLLLVEPMLDKAMPLPPQQAVAEKKPLELVVQLIKRWRDVAYENADPCLAPISVVLTTLAGHAYNGEPSVGRALTSVLNGIVGFLDDARSRGVPLRVLNPSNLQENLSERWEANPASYLAFDKGVREFHRLWSWLVAKGGNVNAELERLFGKPVKIVVKKRAQRLQEERLQGRLGVTSSGAITTASSAVTMARPNTFYGTQ